MSSEGGHQSLLNTQHMLLKSVGEVWWWASAVCCKVGMGVRVAASMIDSRSTKQGHSCDANGTDLSR